MSSAPTPKWIQNLRGMPLVLVGCFLGFLSVPIISSTIEEPAFSGPSASFMTTGIWVLAFWILPLVTSYALVLRHHWVLSLYLIQCAFFLIVALLADGISAQGQRAAQTLLVLSMMYLGLFFGNKNLLYPFLMKSPRLWRRRPRFDIGRSIRVEQKGVWSCNGLLLDASLSGLAVTLPLETYRTELKGLVRGALIEISLNFNEQGQDEKFQLPVKVVWKAETKHGEGKLGCRALDAALMKTYLKAEPLKRQSQIPFQELSDDFALEQDVQRIALLLWILCIAITLSLPGI